MLENLTDIRERVTHKNGEGQRRLHSWTFAQLYTFIAYRAQERGISVVKPVLNVAISIVLIVVRNLCSSAAPAAIVLMLT